MSLGMRALEETHARIERERLDRSIRALELELGLREWDARDAREAAHRMGAQVRYVDQDGILEFVEAERRRLTSTVGSVAA